MSAAQKEAEQPQELSEEERALLALNTLDGGGDAADIDLGDLGELGELGDLGDIDLESLESEGGDDEAASKE
jgi:N utilization substance protein A